MESLDALAGGAFSERVPGRDATEATPVSSDNRWGATLVGSIEVGGNGVPQVGWEAFPGCRARWTDLTRCLTGSGTTVTSSIGICRTNDGVKLSFIG